MLLFEKGFIFGIGATVDVLELPQSLELNILDIFSCCFHEAV